MSRQCGGLTCRVGAMSVSDCFISLLSLLRSCHLLPGGPQEQMNSGADTCLISMCLSPPQSRLGMVTASKLKYLLMPFELTKALAVFQNMLNTNRSVFVYIDNILIFSRLVEEHVQCSGGSWRACCL